MAIHSIGPFNFITLDGGGPGGPPQIARERSMLVQRPGVNGTGVIQLGTKGRPFQMRSVVDTTSVAAGHDLQALYAAACNDALYAIISNGVNYATAYNTWYVVLDVEPLGVRRIGASVGGLSVPSFAVVLAGWTLLPVYVSP